MSDTPLADALKDQYCMSHLVWYNLCGELERELAALREDKARLDWLERRTVSRLQAVLDHVELHKLPIREAIDLAIEEIGQ